MRTQIGALVAVALAAGALGAGSARGQAVSVYSNDQARDCYIAAKFGDKDKHGVADCTSAIVQGQDNHDVAGVMVNRAVIHLGYSHFKLALDDLNAAIKLDQTIAEAYANRGAALIALRQFAAGKTDIDKAIAMGASELQKAYYNRGLADDHLDDETSAYYDYLKASQIDPTWDAPKTELLRFTVKPK